MTTLSHAPLAISAPATAGSGPAPPDPPRPGGRDAPAGPRAARDQRAGARRQRHLAGTDLDVEGNPERAWQRRLAEAEHHYRDVGEREGEHRAEGKDPRQE